MKRIDRCRCC